MFVNSLVGAVILIRQYITPLRNVLCFTQITTDVIAMMNEELQNIGVTHLGDRVILRNICKNINRRYAIWDVSELMFTSYVYIANLQRRKF